MSCPISVLEQTVKIEIIIYNKETAYNGIHFIIISMPHNVSIIDRKHFKLFLSYTSICFKINTVCMVEFFSSFK